MKKIFTFCAALFVAISAMAAFNAPLVKMEMPESGRLALQKKCVETQQKCEPFATITRSYTDPATGITYDVYFYNMGYNWPNMFDSTVWYKQFPEFKDFPYYTVQCILVSDNDPRDQLSFLMCWPSYWAAGLVKNAGDPDWDEFVPLAAFANNDTPNFEVLEKGYLGGNGTSFGMLNGCWTEWEATWKGKKGYPTAGSTVNIADFEEGENFCTIGFRGTLCQMEADNEEGSVVTSYNLKYSGTVKAAGFYPVPKINDFTEVHIFNTGAVTGDNDNWYEVLGYFDEDWGPLQRFYFVATCADVALSDDAFQVDKYEISKQKVYLRGDMDNTEVPGVSYFKGALYNAEGTDNPVALWDQDYFTFEYKGTGWQQIGYPSADKLITSEYNSAMANSCPFISNDCLIGLYRNDFIDMDGNSKMEIGNGTTQGFYVSGTDAYGDPIYMSFKGNVIYHYDDNNFELTREIPAVGDLQPHGAVNTVVAEGNIIKAGNGTITVEVAQNGVIAVYGINGALINRVNAKAGEIVNVNAAKGLYLVKAGNTVKKVAL